MTIKKFLIISDTHIPDRADRIDPRIKSDIEGETPYDYVAFAGDFTCKEILDWVLSLGKEVYYVRGNMDYLPLPKVRVFSIDDIRIGVHHGDGVYPRGNIKQLTMIARKLNVNLLVSGHTHSPFIKVSDDGTVLHVNPGSLTGVWGGGGGLMMPTYIKAYVTDNVIEFRVYLLEYTGLKISERTIYKWDGSKWILLRTFS